MCAIGMLSSFFSTSSLLLLGVREFGGWQRCQTVRTTSPGYVIRLAGKRIHRRRRRPLLLSIIIVTIIIMGEIGENFSSRREN